MNVRIAKKILKYKDRLKYSKQQIARAEAILRGRRNGLEKEGGRKD